MRKKLGENLIKVSVSRTYGYPKSVLSGNLIEDAKIMAEQDFFNELEEARKSNQGVEGFLEKEVTEKLPFSFRQARRNDNESKISIDTASLLAAKEVVRQKYGSLDPAKNPKIFVHEKAIFSDDGVLVHEEEYYLIKEVEDLIFSYNRIFSDIFYNNQEIKIE